MAIHWQVKFKSLRAGELYTVNIYDDNYSGTPVQLTGAAQPFETQEDNPNDMFASVLTQSGYLRIVDKGKDEAGNTFDWREFIPTTDIDRPVTLTDSLGDVKWQGFMQAQNFGAGLYVVPQEREFPVQCGLSVISRSNISANNKKIRNFAYLLKEILDSIPEICRPRRIVAQGGNDAKAWLLKRFDWSNMVEEGVVPLWPEAGYTVESKYDLMECMEQMCKFWGWCARTSDTTLYLTCADDTGETNALVLRHDSLQDDLADLADDIDAGSVETMLSTLTIGNVFASTNNSDFQMRGPNEAVVKSDSNPFDAEIIKFTDKVSKIEIGQGWQNPITEDDKSVLYTNDLLSFSVFGLIGTAVSGKASFNSAEYSESSQEQQGIVKKGFDSYDNLIMIKAPYNGSVFASLETEYEHCFSHDFLEFKGTIYQKTEEYKDEQEHVWYGNSTMYITLGIGSTRATARWITETQDVWSNSPTPVKVTIGNKGNVFQFKQSVSGGTSYVQYLYINEKLTGKLFIDFLGSDDIKEHASSRNFEIRDFTTSMYHDGIMQLLLGLWQDAAEDSSFQDPEPTREYKAKSTDIVRGKMDVDNVYATDNDMTLGSGIIIDPDNGYFKGYYYPGLSYKQTPEQHLANRIVRYWATSKRKIECELLAHDGISVTVAYAMNPRNTFVMDGTMMYPISINHKWRDDVVQSVLMELGTNLPD